MKSGIPTGEISGSDKFLKPKTPPELLRFDGVFSMSILIFVCQEFFEGENRNSY